MKFKLVSDYKPTGDQPKAIKELTQGLIDKKKHQVLLGVTGSGKTFTVANVIADLNLPTLVISHNKTLAGQLYQEFRDFFPENAVSYFVSYYDYYQPEAYIPQTDTYIEKETEINELIDKLRLQATANLLTRNDTLIVASVSCIYNIGSPEEYGNYVLELSINKSINRKEILLNLIKLQYVRSDYEFRRGTFRVRGESLDIYPAYEDWGIRIETEDDKVKTIVKMDPLTGQILNSEFSILNSVVIYPAKHYMTDTTKIKEYFPAILKDLEIRLRELKSQGKTVEAYRLERKVNYDLEMINETGYVNGIENYSRYFDGRNQGDPPYTLIDYYKEKYGDNWLLVVDESHMTIPQIRGMYNGDRSRKQTLIDFGFRLPAALDNRPLKFTEFLQDISSVIYTSATPDEWEVSMADNKVVEQLIRPTGLPDPQIVVKPSKDQIPDLIEEVKKRTINKERVLVTTLTKRMAEDLSTYLKEQDLKVHYLHSEIETLDRGDILDDLRNGKYDVLVGINLLREGLDLPEVSLVAILDADKEGFLRSETALIQVMGRAARNINGQVIMYADNMTGSMERAIKEVNRRREIQIAYNKSYHISPKTIIKPIRGKLVDRPPEEEKERIIGDEVIFQNLENLKKENLTPEDLKKSISHLEKQMKEAAKDLNFELAVIFRDKIKELSS